MRGLLLLLRKYNYVLVFILLETMAIIMLANNNRYQHSILVNASREITGTLFEAVEGTREYMNLGATNKILVEENTRLRNRIRALDEQLGDTVVNPRQVGDYFFFPARIVHSTLYKQFNYLTINKGRKQGVTADMGVIGPQGIVGIVLESSENYATVIPVINRDFRLSVKISKNDFVGVLSWEGISHRIASLNEIPFHADVAVGDSIVTSGYSAVFPEGLFVGSVQEVEQQEGNFYTIRITLGTDFQKLFHVNVINNFNREEQVELEASLKQ